MKTIDKQSKGELGFTIVELLTVMSIIIILMGLVMPALNRVRRYAKRVKQKNQFHSISIAMEFFNTEQDGYPESSARPGPGLADVTTGAHHLAEALVGRDMQGLDPLSTWDAKADELDMAIYGKNAAELDASLERREGPYLKLGELGVFQINELYSTTGNVYDGLISAPPSGSSAPVLTDTYDVKRITLGTTNKVVKAGTPVLYYQSDVSSTKFDYTVPDVSIFNSEDNEDLVALGHLTDSTPAGQHHFDPGYTDQATNKGGTEIFYDKITNPKIPLIGGYGRPYNQDSYILISAGFDGLFGTRDDVCNFGN